MQSRLVSIAVRYSYALPRLPKRPAPCRPARRLTRKVKQDARRLMEAKPWLGPERLAWERQNVAQLQISPATIKRMKCAMHHKLRHDLLYASASFPRLVLAR